MADIGSLFTGLLSVNQGSHEQRMTSALLFTEDADIQLGDRRLNSVAALTYNSTQSDHIFGILEKSLVPDNNPWQTLYKSVLLLHTIVMYGSEKAVDSAIRMCPQLNKLRDYNSALVRRSIFSHSSQDYGGPVRRAVATLYDILTSDDNIRTARENARDGQESLVPLGVVKDTPKAPPQLVFGQGMEKSMGAGFDLASVPGMYEGRPDRYFDDQNDFRRGASTGDHQFTREAMATENLLDLVFDAPSEASAQTELPAADFLPSLQRQRELEAQLAAQQEQLRQLQALNQGQGQQQAYSGHLSLPTPPGQPDQQQPYQQQSYQQPYQQQQSYSQQYGGPHGMMGLSQIQPPNSAYMHHQMYAQPQQGYGGGGMGMGGEPQQQQQHQMCQMSSSQTLGGGAMQLSSHQQQPQYQQQRYSTE